MSTSYGYVVNSKTGESVPLERCLIVVGSGAGTPTVFDKANGRTYQTDPSWVWVPGADDSSPEVMSHPSFRLEMMSAAMKRGEVLDALSDIVARRN